MREAGAGLVDFDVVVGIPVAGDDHPSVRKCHSGQPCTLAAQDACRLAAMCSGVVHLDAPALPYAEVLVATAAQHHLAVRQESREAVVVRIVHRHFVPNAVLEICDRRLQHIAVGDAAENRQLIAQQHSVVPAPRLRQLSQPLRPHLHERHAVHFPQRTQPRLLLPAGRKQHHRQHQRRNRENYFRPP